jgi:3alpha(or 20beta)-hydroxysteroid dehydrogenase
MLETSLDEYRSVVETNQIGCFLGMRTIGRAMVDGGVAGSIINISSVAGLVGNTNLLSYTATKFAICGMTKVAAIELGQFGIRVNSIHPGLVNTEMTRSGANGEMMSEAELAAFAQTFPIKRPAEVIDIARMALFLASEEAEYCTGAEFVVDGGMLAGPT